jgi:hypothetical protein
MTTEKTKSKSGSSGNSSSSSSSLGISFTSGGRQRILGAVADGSLDDTSIATNLNRAVMKYEQECTGEGSSQLLLQDGIEDGTVKKAHGTSRTMSNSSTASGTSTSNKPVPVYLLPRHTVHLQSSDGTDVEWLPILPHAGSTIAITSGTSSLMMVCLDA